MDSLRETFEQFKAALSINDLQSSSSLLSQLKVSLTGFKSIPPLFEETPNATGELILARNVYEQAVILSLKAEDEDGFERNFFQLKPYYTDARNRLPPSSNEYPILGLNLLRLLVQNRIAEFHTELELLPADALKSPCIKYTVELEQSFMEGAYGRVLSARQTIPHETYVYFVDVLVKTVRDEVSSCCEKAYDHLTISEAKQMFMFTSDEALYKFTTEEHPDWAIKNGHVLFQKAKECTPCKEIPSLELINQSLGYARELERIV